MQRSWMGTGVSMDLVAEVRFMARVHFTDSCWLWTGKLSYAGYGAFTVSRKTYVAHRYAYERLVGPIPPGLVLDHICHGRDCQLANDCPHRRCVRPDHLQPCTHGENSRRSRLGLAAPRPYRKREPTPVDFPIVGVGDIAKMFGVSPSRVHQILKTHPTFPKAFDLNRHGLLWDREEVESWDATWKKRTTPAHGTASRYRNQGCRCGPCVEAKHAADREYARRKREQRKVNDPFDLLMCRAWAAYTGKPK